MDAVSEFHNEFNDGTTQLKARLLNTVKLLLNTGLE